MNNTPTDAEIIALADETRTGEPGRAGYILPIGFARAVLAKWGKVTPAPVGVEPQPSTEGPPEVWLQLHGDCAEPELSEPVDYTAGDVTWCWHSIHDSDVRYVRADLAPQPTQAQAGAVPLSIAEEERMLAQWDYEMHGDRARYIEAAHGIGIKGGQHGTE